MMSKMADKVDITKKILETRKQTEELKAQLQNLIDTGKNVMDSGFHSGIVNSVDGSSGGEGNSKSSPNKVQIIRSFDVQHSSHTNKPETSKNIPKVPCNKENITKKESPRKIRNYDVTEARQYIKKQREKRLEQLKFQNEEKCRIENQKKKLQELHKKSLELVTKNVQAKRERSKSRDKNVYVRPQENIRNESVKTGVKQTRSRSVSRERGQQKASEKISHKSRSKSNTRDNYVAKKTTECDKKKEIQPRNPNLLYPPLPDYMQRKITNREKTDNNKVNEQIESHREILIPEESETKSDAKIGTNGAVTPIKHLMPVNLFNSLEDELQKINYMQENHVAKEKSSTETNELVEDSTDNKLSKEQKRHINVISNIAQHFDNFKEQIESPKRKKNETIKNSVFSQMNTSKNNLEKETQTLEVRKECPEWLQEQPVQAYPFNFINTVKRKLQYTVNSPKPSTDVAVHSSLIADMSANTQLEHMKTREQLREIIQESTKSKNNSEMKSFISHKRLNLDPKSIDHLELIPQRSINKNNSRNHQIHEIDSRTVTQPTETSSESDTSKNIPEISSESGTSLKKNAESVKKNLNSELKLSINTDKISNMRLIPPSINSNISVPKYSLEISTNKGTPHSIPKSKVGEKSKSQSSQIISTEKERKGFDKLSVPSVENEYTSDFHSGSDLDLSYQDLARSRDSIIAFNSPKYETQIVTLSPDYMRTNFCTITSNNINLENEQNKNISESSATSSKLKHSKNIPQTISSTSKSDVFSNEPHSKKVEYCSKDELTSVHSRSEAKKSGKSSKSSLEFTSLHTSFHPSKTLSNQLSKSDSNVQSINTQRGSSYFSKNDELGVLPLKEPSVFLTEPEIIKEFLEENKDINRSTKNMSLKSNMSRPVVGANGTNEIHLKFEAEIHLLNDFNESLRQFSAVEKVFETLKTNNELTSSKILQNQDTQTSAMAKLSTTSRSTEIDAGSDKSRMSGTSTINYSRGSFVTSAVDDDFKIFNNSALQPESNSLISTTRTDVLPMNVTKSSSLIRSNDNLSNFENIQANNFAGLSLNMFEQLIKDEDARLENLKTILKIREQVLLDRTKGELAWLEIQRKHFKETGQLQEASVIKKKQRGILVNHQKEKHEMQRLKQMQKAASIERKIVLKEQRNLIRQQLSTDSMLKKMKVSTPRDRRLSGPLKVIQNHTESIRSETSISKRSSTDREKEVLSITSHHSMISKVSEISEIEVSSRGVQSDPESIEQQSAMKRTLLMREEALKKRKKAAEELLQWHKKLLEEEKRIAELESTASAIISQQPTTSKPLEKYKFKGKQLNQLWYNLTGCEKKKFIEDKIYPMSQMALERFCKSAREYSNKSKKLLRRTSDSEAKLNSSVSESIPEQKDSHPISGRAAADSPIHSPPKVVSSTDYVSDFDVESIEDIVNNEDVDVVDQSINLLIDNFSKLEQDISARGSNHSKHSDEETNITEDISKDSRFEKSESEAEISVIETNRASRESELKSSSEKMLLEEINTTESEVISQKINHCIAAVAEESNISEYIETGKQNSYKENSVSLLKGSPEADTIKSEDNDLTDEKENGQNLHMLTVNKPVTENSETLTQSSLFISEAKDNLNDSKEILLILGEAETNNYVDLTNDGNITNNLSATEDILSRLSQVITDLSLEKKSDIEKDSDLVNELDRVNDSLQISRDSDLKSFSEKLSSPPAENKDLSESLDLLMKISQSDERIQSDEETGKLSLTNSNNILRDVSALEDLTDKSADKIIENSCVQEEINIDLAGVSRVNLEGDDLPVDLKCSQTSPHSVEPLEISDEDNGSVLPSNVVDEKKVTPNEVVEIESDENISTDETRKSPVVELVSSSSNEHIPSETKTSVTENLVIEELQSSPTNSEGSSGKPSLDLSYGIIESARSNEADNFEKYMDDKESEPITAKEDINSYEEKELDSLSSPTDGGSPREKADLNEESISTEELKSSVSGCESSEFKSKDVRKRVSEIMAEANQSSKGDKSPRMQDLYVTTYDLISPASSPEPVSPTRREPNFLPSTSLFGNEAEELLKKQLAIEQEIKAITEQQKKEQQIPHIFVREIPNKPPPPYTPPSSLSTGNPVTIIPTPSEIEEICKYSAKILHKAYLSKNLENICISENTLSLISKDIIKECYKFVFDLCKEIAKEHYSQFEEEKGPSWLRSNKKNRLAVLQPLDVIGLEAYMIKKLKELFVYEKSAKRENAIIKWSRKKRDHVDEILVMESQAEEPKWINYDKDELLVINQVTNEIMNSLLKETGEVLNNIFLKRT
ncbi:uncharacterized protein [Leptinotarsa decemlineata]|uniref:uncharacterized protein n=1 Tax=Leptinotarsa decemlineata TaxID=7539 RepID=UPI003D30AC9E